MLTIAEFIAREQIVAEAVRIPARTDCAANQWGASARHWVVTLTRPTGRYPASSAQLAVQFSQGSAHTKAPTCADVLDSLASDARLAQNTFADFCVEIGADEDSRKAEAAYRECADIMGRLAAFLGSRAVFRELLDDVEGL